VPEESAPRLTPLHEGDLNAAQQQMWTALTAGGRGAKALREEGYLTGPFDVLLRAPAVGDAVAGLGDLLRFSTELSQRHRELIIVTVAGRWRARFAWLRHAVYAQQAGLPPEVLDAIAAGTEPTFADDADRAVHAFVHSLLETGAVTDEVHAEAVGLLGVQQVVELTALAGYYCLCSFVLNAFRVPLPAGTQVPWTGEGTSR
jgi:4-carboxymuconolactone decarboxylase